MRQADNYTKVILTVIAILLALHLVKPIIEPSKATAQGPTDVRIVRVAPYAFQYAGPLEIWGKVKSE